MEPYFFKTPNFNLSLIKDVCMIFKNLASTITKYLVLTFLLYICVWDTSTLTFVFKTVNRPPNS